MDRSVLQEYIDACKLVEETEQDIQRLNQKKKTILQTTVKGSNPDFPYQEQHFRVQGAIFTVKDDSSLRQEEALLNQRKANAERIKLQVESWMNGISARMQRIIRYKFFEGMSWEKTAAKIGRKTTGDSIRMEFERFMKEN